MIARHSKSVALALFLILLAGCSGGSRAPAVQDTGAEEAARVVRENARADSVIITRRGMGAPDATLTAVAAGALASWIDGVHHRDAAFTPDSLVWLPERPLTADPGMKLTATFMDTLAHGNFGFVLSPDGALAVDPQFRRFFEDDSAHVTIMADPMITVYEFPARRRHVIDTGNAVAGDVWESVAWLDPRHLVVGGWIRLGERNAPAVRVYDLARPSVREALAPAIAAGGTP
jgi:hypothetical protein